MKVQIVFGEIVQNSIPHFAGEIIEIEDRKVSRFGDQVIPVVRTVQAGETKEPEKEPDQPPADDSGKKKKGQE